MAKVQLPSVKNVQPDVAGALEEIRSKKSREQIKVERFRPFVPVIKAALECGWKWSPILRLIRERSGPSLTKKEAEELYKANKPTSMSDPLGAIEAGHIGGTDASGVQQGVTQ